MDRADASMVRATPPWPHWLRGIAISLRFSPEDLVQMRRSSRNKPVSMVVCSNAPVRAHRPVALPIQYLAGDLAISHKDLPAATAGDLVVVGGNQECRALLTVDLVNQLHHLVG